TRGALLSLFPVGLRDRAHWKSPLLPGEERNCVKSGATRMTWEICASLLKRRSSQTLSLDLCCSMGFQNLVEKNPHRAYRIDRLLRTPSSDQTPAPHIITRIAITTV